jgi:hypothetical protein
MPSWSRFSAPSSSLTTSEIATRASFGQHTPGRAAPYPTRSCSDMLTSVACTLGRAAVYRTDRGDASVSQIRHGARSGLSGLVAACHQRPRRLGPADPSRRPMRSSLAAWIGAPSESRAGTAGSCSGRWRCSRAGWSAPARRLCSCGSVWWSRPTEGRSTARRDMTRPATLQYPSATFAADGGSEESKPSPEFGCARPAQRGLERGDATGAPRRSARLPSSSSPERGTTGGRSCTN